MKSWMLFPVLMLVCIAAQADVYRWVDADGKVHFSDQLPPADIKQFEKIKAAGGKSSDAPLPYALQQAVNNFPVTLYSSACGDGCTRARQLLEKRGIPHTEADATEPTVQEELKKLTGGTIEVPVLKVGRDTLRGFEEGRWNTALDAAGYPQTAVIPPSQTTTRLAKPAASPATQPPPAEVAR
ncbi:MAG TPA: glutaredoxin family protein [Burkholderiales bacterium]